MHSYERERARRGGQWLVGEGIGSQERKGP